jgi:hypothetical protein
VPVEVCGAGAVTHRAGDDEAAVTVVGQVHHRDVDDAWVCTQDRLDLLGVDVGGPGDDQLVGPGRRAGVAVVVGDHQVAGPVPAAGHGGGAVEVFEEQRVLTPEQAGQAVIDLLTADAYDQDAYVLTSTDPLA